MPPLPLPLSPYQRHRAAWVGCTRCHLHEHRANVCTGRGVLPADVVFVGEAPGDSEDATGTVFIGPAGKLLDRIIDQAFGGCSLCQACGKVGVKNSACGCCRPNLGADVSRPIRYALTNLVGCIPKADTGRKVKDGPDDESIEACTPRLRDFLRLARPRLVVAVGKQAEDRLRPGFKHSMELPGSPKLAYVVHPAAILRMTTAAQSMAVRRCVVTLSTALEDL